MNEIIYGKLSASLPDFGDSSDGLLMETKLKKGAKQ